MTCCAQVLVETYEEGDHITRYIQADGNIPINHKLSIIGSGTMLQVRGAILQLRAFCVCSRLWIMTPASTSLCRAKKLDEASVRRQSQQLFVCTWPVACR
jgi:hypothetical protein